MAKNPNIPRGYRLLEKGDPVKRGDLYYYASAPTPDLSQWSPSTNWQSGVMQGEQSSNCVYIRKVRRKAKAKPKAKLPAPDYRYKLRTFLDNKRVFSHSFTEEQAKAFKNEALRFIRELESNFKI